jgi:hypothetical protein
MSVQIRLRERPVQSELSIAIEVPGPIEESLGCRRARKYFAELRHDLLWLVRNLHDDAVRLLAFTRVKWVTSPFQRFPLVLIAVAVIWREGWEITDVKLLLHRRS